MLGTASSFIELRNQAARNGAVSFFFSRQNFRVRRINVLRLVSFSAYARPSIFEMTALSLRLLEGASWNPIGFSYCPYVLIFTDHRISTARSLLAIASSSPEGCWFPKHARRTPSRASTTRRIEGLMRKFAGAPAGSHRGSIAAHLCS